MKRTVPISWAQCVKDDGNLRVIHKRLLRKEEHDTRMRTPDFETSAAFLGLVTKWSEISPFGRFLHTEIYHKLAIKGLNWII
jgi:hypothetical protein